MKKSIVLVFILLFVKFSFSQDKDWPGIPGMNYDGIVLIDQNSFLSVLGAATVSFGLAEFVFKESDLDYYGFRTGIYGTTRGTVILENFGIEKRVSSWFGLGLEINNQQWLYEEQNGAGMGFNTYYRWHLFGKKKIAPYLEYGAGVFYGFSEFPPGGTKFTFNLTTQLGLDYTFENKNKLRISYGHLHQSNNGLLDVNPGEDGNGFNVSFLWFWKESNKSIDQISN